EIRFAQIALEAQVRGDIFEKDRAFATLGHFPRVAGDEARVFTGGQDRIEMPEIDLRRAGKSDVLTNPLSPRLRRHARELFDPLRVQRARRAQAEPEPVDEEWVLLPQCSEPFLTAGKE